MKARQVTDPEELVMLFEPDPETHLYGLADLDEPFWSRSTWFRREEAVVGVVGLDDEHTAGYAMSRAHPTETVALFVEVESHIPKGATVVGALGMSESLSGKRALEPLGIHHRMILGELNPVDTQRVVPLGSEDLPALVELHSRTAGEGFFLPAMLAGMPFVGIWEEDRIVASAGCHVVSESHGVAAIGAVVTAPDRRGQGLGTAVTSALCSRLVGRYQTIGLNVSTQNATAIGVYQRLGFEILFDYEEVLLL